MMKHLLILAAASLLALACGKEPVPGKPAEEPKIPIELLRPFADAKVALDDVDYIRFEWKAVEGISNYKLYLSTNEDLSSPQVLVPDSNPINIEKDEMDRILESLGVSADKSADIYWSILPFRDNCKIENQIRKFSITRKTPPIIIPYEERVADPITIKVAIVYEDPIIPGTDGKRMHEVCRVGQGGAWYDPHVQSRQFELDMEEISHGVVQYEIVKTIQADTLFSFYNKKAGNPPVPLEDLLDFFSRGEVPGIGAGVEYDYIGMLKYYGFDKMCDAGDLQEVWVYTHPACGMYESRMIGKGAFWSNSPGIGTAQGAPCTELINVMFCNYERTVDLAIHSYGHRYESTMHKVYGTSHSWDYDSVSSAKQLNKWQLFSAYKDKYNKYESGYSHIGNVHFPPNGTGDYDYDNRTNVKTYADEWINYPDVPCKNARQVTSKEWDYGQYGYMKWYFSHVPHFKGINTLDEDDLHLNNWWYYVVAYNKAVRYERELQMMQ